jgi:hypothetical protein
MASAENNIESIVIAALQSGALAAVMIRHHDDDRDTLISDDDAIDEGPSRIVVKCEPPIPHIPGRKPSAPAAIMEAQVTITARGTFGDKTADQFDAWASAVDSLLAAPVAAAVTLATTHFPHGLEFDNPNQGMRWEGVSETRTRTRTFRAIYKP